MEMNCISVLPCSGDSILRCLALFGEKDTVREFEYDGVRDSMKIGEWNVRGKIL